MSKRLFIFSVVLAVSITLKPIHTLGQQSEEPQKEEKKSQKLPPTKAQKLSDTAKSNSTKITDKNKTSQTNQANSPSTAPLLQAQPTTDQSKSDSKPPDENMEIQRQNLEIQRKLSRFTGLLVLVAFLQIIPIVIQAIWGIRAANAAKKSADVAKTALHLGQRAYLIAQRWEVKVFEAGRPPLVSAYVLNSGLSIAKNIRVEGNFRIRTSQLPDIPEWPGYEDSGAGQALGPNGIKASTLEGDDMLTVEKMAQLADGITSRLYVWGRISYFDVFSDETRYTTFAFWLDPKTRGAISDAPQSYYYTT